MYRDAGRRVAGVHFGGHTMSARTTVHAALAACAGLIACSDVGLYSETRVRTEPDRVTLTGRVCADDPVSARFPVRVVLLVDQAQGPLFSDFDPAGLRIASLSGFVQRGLQSTATSFAIVGYAGRARTLAPAPDASSPTGVPTASFTRNPGELLAALAQLGIAAPCLGAGAAQGPGPSRGRCRDGLEGLRSARALIEGDMASLPAGTRVLTQYVVVHVVAGPQDPPATETVDGAPCADLACQREREVDEVTALREAIGDAGAAGLRYHVIQLAAGDPAEVDALALGLRQVALAGRGLYQRIGAVGALDAGALDLLDVRTELRSKHLVVANVNTKPTADGPAPDSDADGLSDVEEATTGTAPDRKDSDGDGIGDYVEVLVGLRPLEADTPVACEGLVPGRDSDRDGLTDCDERLIGTDPSLVDSDGDGGPDRLELVSQLDYLHVDADLDADGDGLDNGVELQQRSDPRSDDLQVGLDDGYRYELHDEGIVEERFVSRVEALEGLTVTHVSDGTTPGLGLIEWMPKLQPGGIVMRWRDPAETQPGPFVAVDGDGDYTLPAATFAPIQGEGGRFLNVTVALARMPTDNLAEGVRVNLRARSCIDWTVRNVRLVPTLALADGTGAETSPETAAGHNQVIVYFAQAPEERLTIAGPVRLAAIPFVFAPPARREPRGAVIEVLDSEFVTPRPTSSP